MANRAVTILTVHHQDNSLDHCPQTRLLQEPFNVSRRGRGFVKFLPQLSLTIPKMKLRIWRSFNQTVQVAVLQVTKQLVLAVAHLAPVHDMSSNVSNIHKIFIPLHLYPLYSTVPGHVGVRALPGILSKVHSMLTRAFPIQLLNRHITLIIADLSSHYWCHNC